VGDADDRQITAMPKNTKPGIRGTAKPMKPRITHKTPIPMSSTLTVNDTKFDYRLCKNDQRRWWQTPHKLSTDIEQGRQRTAR
jgi:hypothetical protein